MQAPDNEQSSHGLPSRLPANVLEALRQGQTIEAIKRLREAFGIGLKEAKDVVDAYQSGDPLPDNLGVRPDALASKTLPADVIEALRQGNKIDAIRRLREHMPELGLKEAKDIVESGELVAPRVLRGGRTMLAPGEVPRRSHTALWLVVGGVAVAAVICYAVLNPA